MRRFPWILTIASALVLAVLVTLGVWQVQRLQWKQGLIAQAEQAGAALPEAPSWVLGADNPEFSRVALICPGLATAPYVELQTIHEGQPGVRLISACRHPGYPQTLLVDRGFVADAISARPPVAASEAPTQLVAQVRRTPPPGPMALAAEGRRFFARDNAAMARALGVEGPVAPWTLFALTSSNPEWLALKPSAPPAAFSNNHLGYAITWFGLALALIGVYVALLRRKLRGGPEKSPS
ncbi:SURF1 family protein [Brevundimonas sp.]|uniref:SURF1 family protein n=1 Tax=Brevundimonas sp. TaxID=1871086 RepID=UPI002D47B028|nr:SURF1 family cytochrome oxidase biogenesis protein [Brevundimonas sp.]HYC74359.1 SURF1 family cytochrome oxidase biogenesis protein [Brevundimonas sp.]